MKLLLVTLFTQGLCPSSHHLLLCPCLGDLQSTMFYPMKAKFLALLVLYFCISIAVADPRAIQRHRRDGSVTPSTITEASETQSSSPTQSGGSSGRKNGGDSTSSYSAAVSSTVVLTSPNSTSNLASKPTSTIDITAVTSNINGAAPTAPTNGFIFNCMPYSPESLI